MNTVFHRHLFVLNSLVFLLHPTVQGQTVGPLTFINTPITVVLDTLQSLYAVNFAYNPDELEGMYVHSHIEHQPMPGVITDVLKKSGLEYLQVGDHEYLIRKQSYLQDIVPTLLKGNVSDALSHIPLAWASIQDVSSEAWAYTDETGHFELRIPDGTQSGILQVNYLGYESASFHWQANQVPRIALQAATHSLPTIEIIDKLPLPKPKIENSAHSRHQMRQKIPLGTIGTGNELAPFQYLPSVDATQGLSAGLRLRGGDDTENLYLLDDIEFYNVGHFFGVFSVFEPLTIDSTQLYLTDFPIEYGGRTSGVIDMKMKEAATEGFGGILDIHSLYSHIQLDLKLTSQSSLLLSTRFTHGDISDTDIFDVLFKNSESQRQKVTTGDNSLLLSIVPQFRFNDNQLKWAWNPDNKTKLSLTLIGGKDRYDATYNYVETRKINSVSSTVTHEITEKLHWQNQGMNFHFLKEMSKNWLSELDISLSGQNNVQNLNAAVIISLPRRKDTVSLENATKNLISGGTIKTRHEVRINGKNKVTMGASVDNHRSMISIDLRKEERVRTDTCINLNTFFEYHFNPTAHWSIKAGLRPSYYVPLRETFYSPRAAITYRPNAHLTMGSSVGMYNQYLRSLVYEDRFGKTHDFWLLANDSIPVLHSQHQNLYAQYSREGLSIKAEYFRKRSENEIEQMWVFRGFDPTNNEPLVSRLEIFRGRGSIDGLDILATYCTSHWSTSLSYTYSKNTISIDRIDNGTPFPSPSDRRHEFNGVLEWHLKAWKMGIAGVYGSGLPYVSALTVNGQDRRNLTVEETIDRLPSYVRWDFATSYDFTLLRQKFNLGLSIYNIFNRSNTDQIQYLYNLPGPTTGDQQGNTIVGSETLLLPRTWDIFFKWSF